MSKECIDRTQNTKPRSFFQRFLHSSIVRSCWATSHSTLEEPVRPSNSLIEPSSSLLTTEQATGYDSTNVAERPIVGPSTSKNNQEDVKEREVVVLTSDKRPENIEPQQSSNVYPAPLDAAEDYSTSSSEELSNEGRRDSIVQQYSARESGPTLAEYLIASSQHYHHENDDEADNFEDLAGQKTEWERYTMLPDIPFPKKPEKEVYDDLIAHSLDDYDEKEEWEFELRHRDKPIEFGPITQAEHTRLTFCRIKRHNARSTLKNDTAKSYYFASQVGEGSYSVVYEAFRSDDKKQYAIKVTNKHQIARERKVQYVTREKDIMATLNHGFGGHPFICGIFCTFQEVDKLCKCYCSFQRDYSACLDYVITYSAHGELLMW